MTLTFMTLPKYLFTSESVTEGHPDKLCDQVSDAVLDELIRQDPYSRVACECATKTGFVMAMGEITTKGFADFDKLVRDVVIGVGYDRAKKGFDGATCGVMVALANQSPDIAQGVDKAKEFKNGEMSEDDLEAIGAGDQGMMFGYACNETDVLMPMPIYYAHKLTRRLAEARRANDLDFLWPDGKSQVTVEYEYGKPKRIHTVLISTQHSPDVTLDQIREGVIEEIIKPTLPAELLDDDLIVFVNPTGRFVIGGPMGDAGVTGRKIIVDTYGGMGRHGGGAFIGKDPTKVDRSGAYAARWVAKNVVAAGLADRCEVQLSYAIGVAEPLSVKVDTFGTAAVPEGRICELIREHFPLKPKEMIKYLNLLRPIYRKTVAGGHFGRSDPDFTWERTDVAAKLRKAAGL